MQKVFVFDDEMITRTDPNYKEMVRIHAKEWELEPSTFFCENCQNDLPKGFAHSEDCEMLIAIWL